MILLTLIGCLAHKTTLTGVVDYVGDKSCTIILDSSDMVIINSSVCKGSEEGDVIYFYARRQ